MSTAPGETPQIITNQSNFEYQSPENLAYFGQDSGNVNRSQVIIDL